MYDFTQDFTDYQKLVPNADLTVKTPSTVTTQPQGYDFNKDLEGYRKIAPDMSGLESVNDPLIKKAQLAQEKQTEEDKKKIQLAADLMIESGYSPDPEGVASAQMTEGARKSLAGMQDKVLSKAGVITQRFGNRNAIEKFSGGVNYGTDIGVPKGTKVSVPPGKWKVMEAYAGAEEGKSAVNRGYGNSILVQNTETGEKLRFSHLKDVGVRPNEVIDGNKIVGTVGLTGNTTGPHLDLEMYDRSGRLIDILNTPYSSYLGLGQGGGSGKGGGNPMMDKITQVGRDVIGAVADTPVLPFLPQVTPRALLTRPPGTFTPLDPGSYYGNFKQNPKRAMMDTVIALSTGPQPNKKLGIEQIDDAIDTIRGRIGQPNDQIEAINDVAKFAKENLNPKELKIANKNLDSLIDSVIGKFDDPIDIKKAQIARDGLENNIGKKLDLTSTPKPSTGGEIGGTTLYHGGSAKSFQDYQVGHGEYGTDRLTQHPIGIYTTEDKNIASKFGDVIQGKLAEGKKVLDLTNEKTVKDVWDKLGYKKEFVSPYDSLQPDTTMKHLGSQYKLVEDLINSNPEIKDKLIKDGYSGIRFVDRTGGANHSTSVIFNPKDIVSGEIPKGVKK